MHTTIMNQHWFFYSRLILVAIVSIVVVSCSDGSDLSVTSTGPTTNPTGNCSMLLGSNVQVESDFRIDLELKGELGECLPPQGRIVARIYGIDKTYADVPATQIMLIVTPTLAAGEIYPLRFNRSDLDKVEFQSNSTDALNFYVDLFVNIDGAGEICNGDYAPNYDLTEFTLFNETVPFHSLGMFLVELDRRPCQ